MTKYFLAATVAFSFVSCGNPAPSANTCPSSIEISGTSYVTTSCTIKVGTPIIIRASNGHPLTGSGAKQTISSATTDQNIAFAEAGTFNFTCDQHGAIGMKGLITVVP